MKSAAKAAAAAQRSAVVLCWLMRTAPRSPLQRLLLMGHSSSGGREGEERGEKREEKG